MTCLGKAGSRRRKAVAAQPLTKTWRVFNTLREIRKPMKKFGLAVGGSYLESILCDKVFEFNTRNFLRCHHECSDLRIHSNWRAAVRFAGYARSAVLLLPHRPVPGHAHDDHVHGGKPAPAARRLSNCRVSGAVPG